jgi:hypothetical protein
MAAGCAVLVQPAGSDTGAMNILTWHGAVVRLDRRRNRLVQDPLWLTDTDGADFAFDAGSPEPLKTPLGEVSIERAARAGTVRLRHGHKILRALPSHRELSFEQEEEHDAWGSFLVLAPNDLADLRHILENRWRVRPSLRVLEKADIRVTGGFGLELGGMYLDLAASLPLTSYTRRSIPAGGGTRYVPPASFVIKPGDESSESIELANSHAKNLAPTLNFELMPRRQPAPLEVQTREAFMRATNCQLTLPAEEASFSAPPIVMRARDLAMFVRYAGQAPRSPIGFIGATCRMRREPKRFVALSRGCEGLVFDQDGTWSDIDLLEDAPDLPVGFARRGQQAWIDRDALQEAPKLEGPLLVFYDGGLNRYANWLTGAMPVLDALSRQVPRTSRVLLPGTLLHIQRRASSFNHRDIMKLCGFSRLPAVESSADVVWVDDVIFMDRPTPDQVPADQLRDFRDRVLQPFGGPGERNKRIYIKRPGAGGVAERNEIERFLALQGFEHIQLEYLAHEAQLRLFQEAAFVVGAHGGGLANLVFSYPGVKVLELMPDDAFRPDFWSLAGKLGHVYGFLGCPVTSEQGDPRLVPNFQHFRDLFNTLEAYQA